MKFGIPQAAHCKPDVEPPARYLEWLTEAAYAISMRSPNSTSIPAGYGDKHGRPRWRIAVNMRSIEMFGKYVLPEFKRARSGR